MSIFNFLSTNMAISGHFWCAVFEAQKRGFYFVDALLFSFVKNNRISLCRRISLAFSQNRRSFALSTHFSRKTLCRRNSPEKHLVDAFLQKNTWSTHFSRKTLCRRISSDKYFVDAFLNKTLHFSPRETLCRLISAIKHCVDTFLT